MQASFFKFVIKQIKIKTILDANRLVRNVVAHPTFDYEKDLDKLNAFTFIIENNKNKIFKNNMQRIRYFYNLVKNHL